MTQTVSVDEAQEKLPDLLAEALAGNEIIITELGKPVARQIFALKSPKGMPAFSQVSPRTRGRGQIITT